MARPRSSTRSPYGTGESTGLSVREYIQTALFIPSVVSSKGRNHTCLNCSARKRIRENAEINAQLQPEVSERSEKFSFGNRFGFFEGELQLQHATHHLIARTAPLPERRSRVPWSSPQSSSSAHGSELPSGRGRSAARRSAGAPGTQEPPR